jgi:ribonucleoside-diphosphate reductase alpha chain
MSDFQYKIFLDRYALKSENKDDLEVGNVVIAKLAEGREIGVVTHVDTDWNTASIKIADSIVLHDVDITSLDIPIELSPDDMWQRVATEVASAEAEGSPRAREFWREAFYGLLGNWKFVPGGRILAGAGMSELSYYNCFVLPSPIDSKGSIFKRAYQMSQMMSRGGGVGINLSTLRPRYAKTYTTNGRSSGAVSWGGIYSTITGLIEQGGSRRGALMLVLEDWHPDIVEFITAKQNPNVLTNANVSVGVSDDFMDAVRLDQPWKLKFPDTGCEGYDERWDGDIKAWEKAGLPVIVHSTMPARELWDLIIESAWKCAEPGLWFKDRANKTSNTAYYETLVCTNPCGEQPLPPWGVCNLGSINLAALSVHALDDGNHVDWDELEETVKVAVRFLDNVIDVTAYHFQENENQQMNSRRIGLGTMGLAELLIKFGLRYGSDEAINFATDLYRNIARFAYKASAELAREKGSFPMYDEALLSAWLPERLDAAYPGIVNQIKEHGLRNATLLTQAPTGTTGTMVNTSTGIEPFYFWEYERRGRLGVHTEQARIYAQWLESCNGNADILLPDYYVTAMELDPEEHVRMLAAIQRWCDASVSKTCNVPEDYTVGQIGELYELMYELGCKGGTVYRDHSRDVQVLEKVEEPAVLALEWKNRPPTLVGSTQRLVSPVGTCYVTVNYAEEEPFEVFVTLGKAGNDGAADAEGYGRLISLILRMPSTLLPVERLGAIVAQLRGIGSGKSTGFGSGRVRSLPDAIATVLAGHLYGETDSSEGLPEEENHNSHLSGDMCTECGNYTVVRIEGCQKCLHCGHSYC